MRVRAAVGGYELSDVVLVDGATIHQDSSEAISTCDLTVFQRFGESRYDASEYDHAAFLYAHEIREWDELLVWDQDTTQLLFGGFILSVQRAVEGPHVKVNIQASDWGILFERALITQSWPDGTPDSTIIADALAQVPEISAGTIVTLVANLGLLEAKDQRIRDLLDDVCKLTGGEWNVGYNGKLNYYASGSIVAPFGLSDQPNGSTSMPYALEDYNRDFSDAANRVLVLGAVGDAGELRATAEDSASQAQFGVLSVTLVDRNLADATTANLWAQSEVATRSAPKLTIGAACYEAGLARGMTVEVEASKYGLSAALILRTLEVTILAPDRTRTPVAGHRLKYRATLGSRPPDLVYTLRRMQRHPVQQTAAPATSIAPGTIGPGDFVAGIEPVIVVDVLPALPDPAYSATAIVLLTTDRKLYRRTGNTWTAYVNSDDIAGQLKTSQFVPGSVTSTVLADGSVITAKIPSGAVQAPQLAGGAVTAASIAANAVTAAAIAAQAVTANAIAANAVYAEAIQANAVTTQALAANSVVAGKIAALAVVAGNLAADSVTAGAIAAGAVVAAKIAAGAVSAVHIQAGSITSDKLSAVEIAVGYGANKPGRVAVYNNLQTLVAVLGDMGGAGLPANTYFGVWGRLAAFGGTGYSDAPMYTDLNGNLSLRQAAITITASDGSFIQTGPAAFDSTYGSIAFNVIKSGDSATALVSRGLVIKTSSGTATAGAFVRSPGNSSTAELSINNPSGTLTILLDGTSGFVRAAGFQVGGSPGFNGQIPAGRAINVANGMVTGYV